MTEMQRVVLALAKARAELQRDTPASECLDMLRSLFGSWKLDGSASSLKQDTRCTTLQQCPLTPGNHVVCLRDCHVDQIADQTLHSFSAVLRRQCKCDRINSIFLSRKFSPALCAKH